LAPDLKIRAGRPKWILIELARRYLPKAVVERTEKKGLVVPINRWLKNTGGARGEFDRTAYARMFLSQWKGIFLKKNGVSS
jgi:asparagine synthase (glutamine-hydrolysing)